MLLERVRRNVLKHRSGPYYQKTEIPAVGHYAQSESMKMRMLNYAGRGH